MPVRGRYDADLVLSGCITVLNALLNYFVDLCLLRAAPQDAPGSSALLGVALVVNVLVGLLLIVTARPAPLPALVESLLEVLLMLAVLRAALSLTGRLGRFLQSATAILGSSALLGLASLPLVGWTSGADSGVAELSGLLLLLLVVWSLVVLGHILRHTFNLSLGRGVLLGVLYTFVSYGLIITLFPLD